MKNMTVVFDLDGTLVDTAPDLVASTNHVLGLLGVDAVGESQLREFVGYGARRMIDQALKHRDVEKSEAELDELFATFLTYYTEHTSEHSTPFPGALEMLEALADNRTKMAICTNKVERLSRKLLNELQLSRFFRAIVGRDTLPICKPDPGHLIAAVIMADGSLDSAVMVGDTSIDIQTAKTAGIPSIAVSFGYNDKPVETLGAQVVIDHFDEMPTALETCAKAAQFTL